MTRHPSGKRFVELRDSVIGALPAVTAPRSVRVYWDRSMSRRDDDLAAELALLERYLATLPGAKIEVVSFNSGATPRCAQYAAGAAARHPCALKYRGATSFGVGARASSTPADVCLLFSDGVATVDARPEPRLGCTLFADHQRASDADRGYLELLARLNGGACCRSARRADESAHALRPRRASSRCVPRTAARCVLRRWTPAARGWALVAEAPASGDLIGADRWHRAPAWSSGVMRCPATAGRFCGRWRAVGRLTA